MTDTKYVHAADPIARGMTLCSRTRTGNWVVGLIEFGTLRTPPGPWCPDCSALIDEGRAFN